MKATLALALAAALAGAALVGTAEPVRAQSVGYVTGIPGPDPARDDEFGWGPAYRPETTFAQPGTPPTPGQLAARAYYERTGRRVYDPPVTGSLGFYEEPEVVYAPRRVIRSECIVRRPANARRYVETRRRDRY